MSKLGWFGVVDGDIDVKFSRWVDHSKC